MDQQPRTDNNKKKTEPKKIPTIPGDALFGSREQMARRYGVSTRQIDKWGAEGVLPVCKIGRRLVRFPIKECDATMMRFMAKGVL